MKKFRLAVFFPFSLFVTMFFFLEGLPSLLSSGVESIFLLGIGGQFVES